MIVFNYRIKFNPVSNYIFFILFQVAFEKFAMDTLFFDNRWYDLKLETRVSLLTLRVSCYIPFVRV